MAWQKGMKKREKRERTKKEEERIRERKKERNAKSVIKKSFSAIKTSQGGKEGRVV
jgi:hypothetical protein